MPTATGWVAPAVGPRRTRYTMPRSWRLTALPARTSWRARAAWQGIKRCPWALNTGRYCISDYSQSHPKVVVYPFDTDRPREGGLVKHLPCRSGCHAQPVQYECLVRTYDVSKRLAVAYRTSYLGSIGHPRVVPERSPH